jgi:hypothetical protein
VLGFVGAIVAIIGGFIVIGGVVMRYRARGAGQARRLANEARVCFEDVLAAGGRLPASRFLTPERQQLDRDLEALPDEVGRTLRPLARALSKHYRDAFASSCPPTRAASEGIPPPSSVELKLSAHQREAADEGLKTCWAIQKESARLRRFVIGNEDDR